MTDEIEQLVRDALAERLGVDPEEATAGADLREDLGLDSLDALELMTVLEHRIGHELSDADMDGLRTVGDASALLRHHLSTAGPS